MSSKKNKSSIRDVGIGFAQDQLIQKHGEAASQILQAYKGVRFDSTGKDIGHVGRSLKGISKYKVNEQYKESNYKQQAGFSGELVKEARDNQQAILKGDTTRTRTSDGLGNTNDQLHDHVRVDANGQVIEGSGSQMKMKGKYNSLQEIQASSEKVVRQMVNDKNWEKYQESYMDLPREQAELAKEYAKHQAKTLREQADNHRNSGDAQKAKDLEAKAEKFEQAEKRIRDSGVDSKEAIQARKEPEKFVAKEVARSSHDAGINAAKGAFIMGGTIATAQNIYAILFQEKDIDDAVKDIVVTTSKSAATGYVVGAGGTAIKSLMHTSKNELMRRVGTTNAPAMLATALVEVSKTVTSYAKGELTEVEFLEALGEKGTGMIASAYGASLGTAMGTMILPGPGTIIGSVVGGMIGYTISSILYNESMQILKRAQFAEERRLVIEALCDEAVQSMKQYQQQLEEQYARQQRQRGILFNQLLNAMHSSIAREDVSGFCISINQLGNVLGVKLQFDTIQEFDDFMNDENTVLTL